MVKLVRRYPDSKTEDITDAFNRGVICGMEVCRGTCKDACSRFNAWVCSECGATVLLMFDDYGEPSYSVNDVADVPRYCPNCGRRVVE